MKRFIAALFTLVTLATLGTTVLAADNRVESITVDAVLDTENGSATITQVWTGDFCEGTEVYYPFRLGDDLEITDFTVSDQNGRYKTLDEWDTGRSFKKKAKTCGINEIDDDECEVCWGISQYGKNTYTIRYTVKGVVGGYSDNDGFLFRFINPEMNTGPTAGSVRISLKNGDEINNKNCKIWAFGYDGDIVFDNGTVYASTDSDITEENHMTLLLGFEKGVFAKEIRQGEGTFYDLREQAFDGSYYDDDADIEMIIVIAIFSIVALIIIAVIVINIGLSLKLKRFTKTVGYHREAPCFGDLNAAFALASNFNMCKETGIISARIVNMINDGCIVPVTDESGQRSKTELVFEKRGGDSFDRRLYDIMKAAAGSDGILQRKEMRKYCEKNPTKLRSFIDDCLIYGKQRLPDPEYRKGGFKQMRLDNLTDEGKKQLAELVGYRKYLLEFSLIGERSLQEAPVWQEMLTYATMFGIADEVAKQLKKLYPEYVPQIEEYEFNTVFAYGYCTHMYNAMTVAESNGKGGKASFGGGGGFSGGGFGGGTR